MDDPALWGVISLAFSIFISVVLSITLSALSSVRRQNLRERAEAGSKRAQLAVEVGEDSLRFLDAFSMAKAAMHLISAGLIALLVVMPAANWVNDQLGTALPLGYLLAFLVISPLAAILVYGVTEALPEIIVRGNPTAWAMRTARFARFAILASSPLVGMTTVLRKFFSMILGESASSSAQVTEEEIMTLVDAGEEEGSIELEEKEMIYSIFQLDETLAREIMVPRIDVVALDIKASLDEALDSIISAGHSRIPVFEDSLDRIKGLLYAKDLLEVWREGRETADLASLLRPAVFFPESKRVSDLLHELQNHKVHLAIIIDEYGGTAGLVTIEDIVEEIVGEIFDEYDESTDEGYEVINETEYIFDGRYDLDDFNHMLNTELPDELGDTLGGFIYGHLGKVPEEGEVVETDRLRLEVIDVDDRRIRKVHVTIQHATGDASLQSAEDKKDTNGKSVNGK